MRLGYFGYYVESTDDGETYLVDLRRFVREFVSSNDVNFKSSIHWGGETLLLLPLAENAYLFVQTRELELIKRVQRDEWSADDIKNALDQDQSIGFASYIIFGNNWFGIACRVMSPRQTAFGHLLNEVMSKLNIPFQVIYRAFQSSVDPDEVPQLDRVGLIRIEVNRTSPLMSSFIDLMTGGDGQEFVDATLLEIRVKPSRKRTSDLSGGLQSIVDRLPKNGLESLEARARFEAQDRMSDMYIYGTGAIRDFLDFEHENEVPAAMATAAKRNRRFKASLEELRNDPALETNRTAGQLGISWARTHGGDNDDD